jgi:hypothetical protein
MIVGYDRPAINATAEAMADRSPLGETSERGEAESQGDKMVGHRTSCWGLHYCERTFKVPLESLKRTSEAQESLRKQFAEHRCSK